MWEVHGSSARLRPDGSGPQRRSRTSSPEARLRADVRPGPFVRPCRHRRLARGSRAPATSARRRTSRACLPFTPHGRRAAPDPQTRGSPGSHRPAPPPGRLAQPRRGPCSAGLRYDASLACSSDTLRLPSSLRGLPGRAPVPDPGGPSHTPRHAALEPTALPRTPVGLRVERRTTTRKRSGSPPFAARRLVRHSLRGPLRGTPRRPLPLPAGERRCRPTLRRRPARDRRRRDARGPDADRIGSAPARGPHPPPRVHAGARLGARPAPPGHGAKRPRRALQPASSEPVSLWRIRLQPDGTPPAREPTSQEPDPTSGDQRPDADAPQGPHEGSNLVVPSRTEPARPGTRSRSPDGRCRRPNPSRQNRDGSPGPATRGTVHGFPSRRLRTRDATRSAASSSGTRSCSPLSR